MRWHRSRRAATWRAPRPRAPIPPPPDGRSPYASRRSGPAQCRRRRTTARATRHRSRRPCGCRPVAAGRALQFHLRDLLQQAAKLNDVAVADRIVVLPTVDKHNKAEIAVLRLHLDAVEQCRDLVAVVGLALVVELDKAQQKRLIGLIMLRVRH